MRAIVSEQGGIQVWQEAADGRVCGDLVFAVHAQDALRIMVCDGCGHGQRARDMACSLRDIAVDDLHGPVSADHWRRWNAELLRDLPIGGFVAATLIEVYYTQQEIRIWNAGNPAPMRTAAAGNPPSQIESFGLVLGAIDLEHFSPPTAVDLCLSNSECVIVCSDGLGDQQRGGERFGDARLATTLSTAGHDVIAALRHSAESFLAEEGLCDDLTVVSVSPAGLTAPTQIETDEFSRVAA